MQTLSYGFKKPEDTDTGDVFWVAFSDNFQQLNDHNHDGVNSAPLAAQVLQADSANWISLGGGQYNQLLTLPAGFVYDTSSIWMRNASTGEQVYLKLVKNSATDFYIYTSDNTASYTVLVR